jgi:cell division protein FtsN
MKKVMRIFMMLAIVTFVATSCKTKQKVTEISGANVPATSTTVSPSVTAAPVTTAPVASEPEVTRNESFTLSEGDAASMQYKYHVVVGSFKNPTNAKGLQSTLLSEGNKALVVVNEASWYRVIIASFNGYNEAHAKINQIKDRFADAWVLVQK